LRQENYKRGMPEFYYKPPLATPISRIVFFDLGTFDVSQNQPSKSRCNTCRCAIDHL
jgi:hypothetical protein